MNTFRVTGIILAGGKSSRMGTDKGLICYKGKTLVEHAIDILFPWCDEMILSANASAYDQFGVRRISDYYRNAGPIGGLFSALKASHTTGNLVLACDIPDIPEGLIGELISHSQGAMAVVPVHPDGKTEPLCAWYHRDIIGKMEEQIKKGEYKMTEILTREKVVFLPLEKAVHQYHPGIIPNLNKPEDLNA